MKHTALALVTAFACLLGRPAEARSLLDYVGQCVPFARQASGIQIYGDAWTWWDQAKDRYQRGEQPRVGSVIAFARQSRLPLGHVAVVSRTVESRVLMLTHANWSRFDGERGHAEQDVTVFDVSKNNDWSEVKVWFRDSNGLGGTIYKVHGFIYAPGRPHENLTAKSPDYVGALIDAYVPGAGIDANTRTAR
ncbi:CHAP domain-containing protein [Sphingomonas mucosissima]|uniref:CHAP domain protein n=1 Tax=Sphingomonas mucosissima TaxID=370959 RepID=A0A245ZRW3_9SPHN|nr:CHAP domain-containing protein [Sphingomonas mucosissima]OWK32466.1 CHAP domain protein [Sphingomonas mucosissima]